MPIAIQLGNYTSEILHWGLFPPKYWRNYLHNHSFFEVCYAYQGRGIFRIENQEYTVTAGHLFIAKPGEPHEIISSVTDPLGIYFWQYTLIPQTSSELKQSLKAKQPHGLEGLIEQFRTASDYISKQVGMVPEALRLLTTEINTRQPGYQQQIQSLTTTILIDTARSVIGEEFEAMPLENFGAASVDKIIQYLQDNLHRPIRVRDVAAQFHLSERHISRIFKEATGTSILKYLVQLRISIAKQRLLDHSVPISEVGYSIGYRDPHHFSTLFRKHTEMTPTEFRSKNGTHHFS
ncbi:MAG: AraC family transcriptional regulator [Chloroflexota bacterium]